MFSMPPATMQSASRLRMAWAPSMVVFMPLPQTLLTVVAPMDGGSPALMAAWRAGDWPAPACSTWPMSTSSTSVGWMPDRSTAARMAMAPRSVAGRVDTRPSKRPMGVRAAERITTSRREFAMR